MLGYNIVLKAEGTYNLDVGENDVPHTDGIEYNTALLIDNNFMYPNVCTMVGCTEYEEGMYAYLIANSNGDKTYVHFDWLYKINKRVLKVKELTSNIVKINTTTIFYKDTAEVEDISTVPLCDCGKIATTTFTDGKHICNACIDKLTNLHSYSHKPNPIFVGKQIKADEETPIWYGLEVEMSTKKQGLAEYAHINKDTLYLKSDSSIRGDGYNVEIVTHPHSFNELMRDGGVLDTMSLLSDEKSDNTGTHIHISRTSFVNDKHYSLFYFLLHKLEKVATYIGGRELTDYCRLVPTDKVHTKNNKLKGGGDRTVYLNERNEATVEARFFKGTNNPTMLKSYVQLLDSLIKYSKYHSKTVTGKGWFEYVMKKSSKYQELADRLKEIDVKLLDDTTVVYKLPKYVTKELNKCTVQELFGITSITLADERVYSNIKLYRINGRYIAIEKDNGDGIDIPLAKISTVTYEKE
jgi:hypothetical protein